MNKTPPILITAEWLHLHQDEVNLFDSSFAMPASGKQPALAFLKEHIAGAQFFDIEAASDHTSPLPHMLPSAEEFARYLINLGFDERKPTVIYDSGLMVGAARLWWMLHVFGYTNAAILAGGLNAWKNAGFATTSDVTAQKRGQFTARFNKALVVSKSDVEENLLSKQAILIDTRSAERFQGLEAEPRSGVKSGHIAGAINIPFRSLLNPSTGRILPLDNLKRIFEQNAVDIDKPLIMMCGSGVTACLLSFAVALISGKPAPVYDGSWTEWGSIEKPLERTSAA